MAVLELKLRRFAPETKGWIIIICTAGERRRDWFEDPVTHVALCTSDGRR